jgi:hypothetical protein
MLDEGGATIHDLDSGNRRGRRFVEERMAPSDLMAVTAPDLYFKIPAHNFINPRAEPLHPGGMSRIARKLLVAVLSLAAVAYGHAIVLSTTPAQRQEVSGPDVPVNLRFNSRIDTKRSRLILVMPDGKQVVLTLSEASGQSLISEAKGLKSGSYLLRWQVLASDGHISRGEVPFRVK